MMSDMLQQLCMQLGTLSLRSAFACWLAVRDHAHVPELARVSMTDVLPLPCATAAATTGGGGFACASQPHAEQHECCIR